MGRKSQLSRIRRGIVPWMTDEAKLHKNCVLAPPLAALLVERLEELADGFDARQAPKARMRELLLPQHTAVYEDRYVEQDSLLRKYGVKLEDVARIGDEVADASTAASKRRKVVGKQQGTGALR